MKKIINIIILPILAFSSLDISKINNALSSIQSSSSLSEPLKFYSTSKQLDLMEKLHFTSRNNADIILFPKKKKIQKAFVVDSYGALKEYEQSIGAIYIKKGRTQIIFVRERLENNGFDMTKTSNKYIIRECQLRSICLQK